jgi:hypothetical protein
MEAHLRQAVLLLLLICIFLFLNTSIVVIIDFSSVLVHHASGNFSATAGGR